MEAAEDAAAHGEQAVSTLGYLATPQLWFESFQNWQSEFMSTAVLVVLTIFLRQKNSPESKPLNAPHSQTGQ
jgi:glycerol uptake facilitator-like aquaporin